MWHDHKNMAVADGLAGGLIVRGPSDDALNVQYNVTRDDVLVVTDWYDQNSVMQAKGLNGVVDVEDPSKTGPGYNNFVWNARSLLLDWKGCYNDCTMNSDGTFSCDPDLECKDRYVMNINPDESLRLRIVGAGSGLYQIVCFQGVDVTLIAMDAREVEPVALADGCVDVDLGQRADVIIRGRALEELGDERSFWLVSRADDFGNPASYGVISYSNCSDGSECLPTTPAPQPIDVPKSWSTTGFINNLTSSAGADVPAYVTDARQPDKRLVFQLTAPIMQETSQARWAISNAVYLKTPGCSNVLSQARNAEWLTDANPFVVSNSTALSNVDIYDMPGLGEPGEGSDSAFVYLNLAGNTSITPLQPVAGTPIVETRLGEVIDIVLQDVPEGSLGGLMPNDTNMYSHPFHLHGTHFWVLGSGNGTYSGSNATLNFANPRSADTQVVAAGGWTYLRFQANNPGVWPMHCHIAAHEFGGMVMLFANDVLSLPAMKLREGVLPTCPEACTYSAKLYNETEVADGVNVSSSAKTAVSLTALSVAYLVLVSTPM